MSRSRVFSLALLFLAQPAAAQTPQTFAFSVAGEPASLDPAYATGVPEHQLLMALFEGLTSLDAKTLEPVPGVAKSWQIDNQGKRYRFQLRREARWSDGRAVTADDFVYAWRRLLEPVTAAPYASHLFSVRGARDFHSGSLRDFSKVGVRAVDAATLEVELEHPTAYFLQLCAFYSLLPLPRHVELNSTDVDRHGAKLVSNGAFRLRQWRVGSVIRLDKSPTYWDAAAVSLQSITIYPQQDQQQVLALYMAGKLQWTGSTTLPESALPALRKRGDYHEPARLGTAFLRLNVRQTPLQNIDLRRALFLAIDRQALVQQVTRSGEQPAHSFTPPGISDYSAPHAPSYNITQAVGHFIKAGYCHASARAAKCLPPPQLRLLFNTNERNSALMQAIAQMWRERLGIVNVELQERDWKNFLQQQRQGEYQISRAGWLADYTDPLTFIELFVKDGGNNLTGWWQPHYDELVAAARGEANPMLRGRALAEAEALLLQEVPVLPLYHYTATYLLDSRVGGFYANALDLHPYKSIYIKSPAVP